MGKLSGYSRKEEIFEATNAEGLMSQQHYAKSIMLFWGVL